jgi:hypothetical protein
MAYCGTVDVYYIGGHIKYQQLGFTSEPLFNVWMEGTLIPKAQDMMDNYTGRNWKLNSGTIDLDGNNKEALPLSRAGHINSLPGSLLPVPLLSVTSVTIDSGANISTDIRWYDSYIAYVCGHFCKGRQNVRIIGTWGNSVVPHDIQAVTAQICVNFMTEAIRMRMLPDIMTTVMEGSGNISALMRSPKVLTVNEKAVLDRYRFREIEAG